MESMPLFPRPTSVFLAGTSRVMLNWVAYAMAYSTDPEFHWTDVRLTEQRLSPDDPLAREVIRPDHLSVVHPRDLIPDDMTANAAVSAVIRDDDTPNEVRRVVEFLRLPQQTQGVLTRGPSGAPPKAVVLSNGQRLVAIYPDVNAAAPVVRAIVGSGTVLIMTFADALAGGSAAFETILELEGDDPKGWREGVLRVRGSPATSPLQTGSEYRLADLEPIAEVLRRHLD